MVTWLKRHISTEGIYFFLLSVGITVFLLLIFYPSLKYPLSNGDDLVILTRASQATNPFAFFASDWGLGNNAYRPLHTLSIWIAYQRVGVWAFPNQLLNLVLHIFNTLLVFYLIRSQKAPLWIAALLAILMGSSMYSVSPATWISDRPNLLVAISLNIALILLLGKDLSSRWKAAVTYPLLSIFALLSKESGLIIPLVVIALSAVYQRRYWKTIILSNLFVILAYLTFRLWVFSSQAYAYSESGFLLGLVPYPDNMKFPLFMQVVVYLDNIVKNIAANILMALGPEGGIQPWSDIQLRLGMILSVFLLSVVGFIRRQKNPLGAAAIFILLINALIHFQLFRYRALYTGFEAICLFIGASFAGYRWNSKQWIGWVTACLLFAAIASNYFYTTDHILNQTFKKNREINRYELTTVVSERGNQISPEIVEQVLKMYKRK